MHLRVALWVALVVSDIPRLCIYSSTSTNEHTIHGHMGLSMLFTHKILHEQHDSMRCVNGDYFSFVNDDAMAGMTGKILMRRMESSASLRRGDSSEIDSFSLLATATITIEASGFLQNTFSCTIFFFSCKVLCDAFRHYRLCGHESRRMRRNPRQASQVTSELHGRVPAIFNHAHAA